MVAVLNFEIIQQATNASMVLMTRHVESGPLPKPLLGTCAVHVYRADHHAVHSSSGMADLGRIGRLFFVYRLLSPLSLSRERGQFDL